MSTYSLHHHGEEIKLLQRALNEIDGLHLQTNGRMDSLTQYALGQYQNKHKIKETDKQGPVYGPESQYQLSSYISDRFITFGALDECARMLGVSGAVVKTLIEVLSTNHGFNTDGSLYVIFERHLFYHSIINNVSKQEAETLFNLNPHLCNPRPGGYIGGVKETERFERARVFHELEAITSTSYGLFLMPGARHALCGYDNARCFYESMRESERLQLKAFCTYLKNNSSLHECLVKQDWTSFSRRYYGSAGDSKNFGARLGNAYLKSVASLAVSE